MCIYVSELGQDEMAKISISDRKLSVSVSVSAEISVSVCISVSVSVSVSLQLSVSAEILVQNRTENRNSLTYQNH